MFIILKARSTLPRWGAFLELYDTAVLCKGEQRGDAALFILLPFSLKSQTTAALPKHVRCQRAPQASRPFGAGSLRSALAANMFRQGCHRQAQGTTPGRHVHFPERVHERWGLCPRNRTKKKLLERIMNVWFCCCLLFCSLDVQ